MKIIDMGIFRLLLGLVVANVLLKVPFCGAILVMRYFRNFWCASLCRHDASHATNCYRFAFSLGWIYVGHSSVLIRECIGRLNAIRCYVGLESALNRPSIGVWSADIYQIHNWSKTDKPSVIGGLTKTDTSQNAPRQKRHPIFQTCLKNPPPPQLVCLDINRHQTDKNESIFIINRSLPEFDDFCRFEVGFVSVYPVWLGYKCCSVQTAMFYGETLVLLLIRYIPNCKYAARKQWRLMLKKGARKYYIYGELTKWVFVVSYFCRMKQNISSHKLSYIFCQELDEGFASPMQRCHLISSAKFAAPWAHHHEFSVSGRLISQVISQELLNTWHSIKGWE